MDERSALRRLMELLQKLGYPRNALVLGSRPVGEMAVPFTPDLAVVDPRSREVLAVFEVKRADTPLGTAFGAASLQHYREAGGDEAPHFFLVQPSQEATEPISVFRLSSSDELEAVEQEDLPTFDGLVASRIASSRDEVSKKRSRATNEFAWWCRGLGVGALLLVLADALLQTYAGWQLLTPARLALLGAGAVLFVLPYAAKLKALGVEWERYQDHGDA